MSIFLICLMTIINERMIFLEIILLILGLVFTIYFITMIITSIIMKNKKLKFYILGMTIAIIVAFVGYLIIPIQDQSSIATNSHVNNVEKEVVNNNIVSSMLKINFIDNGDNGCVLLQCGEKNILIDSGRTENVKKIETALKSHSVDNLYSIIITTGDDSTMGAAAKIINDYKVQEVKYIDDSVKLNSHYNELQQAASSNGLELNKIDYKYKIDNIDVETSDLKNNVKIEFSIPKSQNDLRNMSFVKDDFNKSVQNSGLNHDVSASCDSEGNFNISIKVYTK